MAKVNATISIQATRLTRLSALASDCDKSSLDPPVYIFTLSVLAICPDSLPLFGAPLPVSAPPFDDSPPDYGFSFVELLPVESPPVSDPSFVVLSSSASDPLSVYVPSSTPLPVSAPSVDDSVPDSVMLTTPPVVVTGSSSNYLCQ